MGKTGTRFAALNTHSSEMPMDRSGRSVDVFNMPSKIEATSWLTAKLLHQIQILSCDLCEFTVWDVPDHCSPFWRLYWHDKRGAEIELAGKTVAIRPGVLFLIPPNTHFSSRLRNPVRQFFMHFIVEPHYRAAPDTVFPLRATPAQKDCCRRIVTAIKRDTSDIGLSFLSQALVAEALLQLPRDGWAPRVEDPRITRAAETLQRNYPAKTDTRTLAREAGMHPTSFIRLFRQCTGHTPLAYLTNLRLEEACSMLHYDEATLDEIAEKTGFGERGYFTRIFTRGMNCSPARYRKLVNVSSRLRPGD